MKYNIRLTSEDGKYQKDFTLDIDSDREKSLDYFILEALSISEDKRKLPVKVYAPNGLSFYPKIKMQFTGFGSPLLGDELEAMIIQY